MRKAKLPPHSTDAEQGVVGGLLISRHAWPDVADVLRADDFYREDHRLIFETVAALAEAGKPHDLIVVTEHLRSAGRLDAVGGEYIGNLAADTPGAANIRAYAQIVSDRAALRGMIRAGDEMVTSGFADDDTPAADKLDAAEQAVGSIREHRDSGAMVTSKQAMARMVEQMEAALDAKSDITGVATGMPDLDRKTSGLQDGDLIYVAARPGMGKTSFALQAAYSAAKRGEPVAFFSLEMPVEQLAQRAQSVTSGVPLERIRAPKMLNADDWGLFTPAAAEVSHAAITFADMPSLSIRDIRAKARQVHRKTPLRLVVVDYLQLIPGDGRQNRNTEIEQISRALKQLARELKCPVMVLSQLNRDLEKRNNKRPQLADLRDSGSIEQDADLVIAIYRHDVYEDDSPHAGVAEVALIKHRNGALGTVEMHWHAECVRFQPYTGPSRQEREPGESSGQSRFSAQYRKRVAG